MVNWLGGERTRKAPTKKEKELLYDRQKGRCMYCGRKMELGDMHSDHIKPLANDGSDAISNKQVLCGPCNTRKGSTTDGEFRKRYKLTPTRQAKGRPTSPPLKLEYFEQISAALKQQKAAINRAKNADPFGIAPMKRPRLKTPKAVPAKAVAAKRPATQAALGFKEKLQKLSLIELKALATKHRVRVKGKIIEEGFFEDVRAQPTKNEYATALSKVVGESDFK